MLPEGYSIDDCVIVPYNEKEEEVVIQSIYLRNGMSRTTLSDGVSSVVVAPDFFPRLFPQTFFSFL